MADKRPLRLLDAFLTRCRALPPNVASLSYDPATGAMAVSLYRPVAAAQADTGEDEPQQEQDEPIDFRFALERFNDSPKPRQRQ